jgi:hypothetical protein
VVLAFDWTNLAYAGAFVGGLLVGSLLTVRLARTLATFLADLKRKDHQP